MSDRQGTCKPRILLANDEVTLRSSLAEVLKEEGYDVTVTGDGAKALELVERQVSRDSRGDAAGGQIARTRSSVLIVGKAGRAKS